MPIQSWGDVGRGALAGFIGGLAATAVMSAFMTLMGHVADFGSEDESGQDNSAGQEDAASPNDANQEDASVEEAGSATAQVADIIAEKALDQELTLEQAEAAGQIVHYTFGGTMGALYGAAAEIEPNVTMGAGIPYGAAVWLGADEIALPVLKLAEGPTRVPLSLHASALVAHFIYGFCTEMARRALRARW